jgi:pyrimidine-nucleoside phosphorylase
MNENDNDLQFVNALDSDPSIENMHALCLFLSHSQFNKSLIVELTKKLAYSGHTLDLQNSSTADIPSTGGPSSLSTIICPLILKEYHTVPKLGIIGRPAGGIDVLSQIEGYTIKLNKREIYQIIEKTNYCHFISNNEYAPLDSLLFKYRSENNFKDIPSLVIASLLAKKIAVGVKQICLDIRYSNYGNFGKSLHESELLSSNFKSVADLLDLKSYFYFSDNNLLMQPYIGRGEALVAIDEIITGCNNPWLNNHILICKEIVETLLQRNISHMNLQDVIYKNFIENIEAQRGNLDSFFQIAKTTKELHIYELVSPKHGRLKINIEKMRNLIVKIQKKYIFNDNEFPDPCGIIFYKNQSESVSKNDLILTYRVEQRDLELFQTELKSIITVID